MRNKIINVGICLCVAGYISPYAYEHYQVQKCVEEKMEALKADIADAPFCYAEEIACFSSDEKKSAEAQHIEDFFDLKRAQFKHQCQNETFLD